MAKVKMFYHELEVASLRVCRGDTEAASTIDDISRAGIAAMSEAAKALQKYYVEPGQVEMEMMSGAAGPSGICENVTFTSHTLWEDLVGTRPIGPSYVRSLHCIQQIHSSGSIDFRDCGEWRPESFDGRVGLCGGRRGSVHGAFGDGIAKSSRTRTANTGVF